MRTFPPIPSQTVAAVNKWLVTHGVASVHYYGNVDKSLIPGPRTGPNSAFSMTGYFGRWRAETLFHIRDELDEAKRERLRPPDWLNDVRQYFDGIPPVDVLVLDLEPQDWPVPRREELETGKFRQAILIGNARLPLPCSLGLRALGPDLDVLEFAEPRLRRISAFPPTVP